LTSSPDQAQIKPLGERRQRISTTFETQPERMKSSSWRWHLDEIFVKINGERHYLWRAVDHEGEGG